MTDHEAAVAAPLSGEDEDALRRLLATYHPEYSAPIFRPFVVARLLAALDAERAATPEPSPSLREALDAVERKMYDGFAPDVHPIIHRYAQEVRAALAAAPLPSEPLSADTIAARALYATGGNVPTPKVPIADLFEEVRRWVASIGSTNLKTGRKVTKADALAVIDRAMEGLL